jgi:ribosomal protein L37AE/L43A
MRRRAKLSQQVPKHQCPDCGKAFPKASGLKMHRARWCDGDIRRSGTVADTGHGA